MKRKFLIVFLGVLIFTCLFAISVFGAVDYSEIATLADGTKLPIYDEAHNPLIWYVSGVDADGNNVYSSVPNNRNEPNDNNDTYVTYVSTTGTWAQLNDIYIHTYNESTGEYVSTIDDNLKIVVLNLREFDMIYLGGINVNHIQYMYYPATLKDCPDKFKTKTELRLVDMSVCTNLVGGFGGTQNFRDCTNLHTVRLPIGPSYTLEGGVNYKFKSTAISSIIIPEAVTSLGTDNFEGCTNLKSIYILGSNTSLGRLNFEMCTSLENIYFLGNTCSATPTEFIENFVECVDGNTTYTFEGIGKYFYFVSTDMNYLTSVKEAVGAVSVISYNDYKENPSNYADGRYVIYGANVCEILYNNEHDLEEVDNCLEQRACERTNCDYIFVSEYTEHNMAETLVYPNGFTVVGVYNKHCSNALGCTVGKVVDGQAPAIFVMNEYNGFSESGKDGIAFGGYCLNADALNEYNRINKDAPVKYGVVLINPDYLDGKDSFFKDGKVNSTTENKGFLQTDMSSARYVNISIAITGFTGNAENLSLILAIYAYTDDSDVEFIQSQTTKCASEIVTLGETSLYTVTLASVKAGNSNLSDLGEYVMPSKREQE
ncbi:MAG: hypothetical protein E7622_05665 [Ruminococcaceae bacterium]|nr:hypothetical protein [Oscillospiraceae bacterium]